jgi:hypothetical protein
VTSRAAVVYSHKNETIDVITSKNVGLQSDYVISWVKHQQSQILTEF